MSFLYSHEKNMQSKITKKAWMLHSCLNIEIEAHIFFNERQNTLHSASQYLHKSFGAMHSDIRYHSCFAFKICLLPITNMEFVSDSNIRAQSFILITNLPLSRQSYPLFEIYSHYLNKKMCVASMISSIQTRFATSP